MRKGNILIKQQHQLQFAVNVKIFYCYISTGAKKPARQTGSIVCPEHSRFR